MSFRDFVFFIIMFLFLFLYFVISFTGTQLQVYFPFIFALIVYIKFRSVYGIVFIFVMLFFVDAFLGVNPSFSVISLSVSGLGLAILARFVTILKKKYPFVILRALWLGAAIVIYNAISGNLQVLLRGQFLIIMVINMVVLLIFTYLIEPIIDTRSNNEEILIS